MTILILLFISSVLWYPNRLHALRFKLLIYANLSFWTDTIKVGFDSKFISSALKM